MLRQLRSYLALASRIWQAPGNHGRRVSRLLRSITWLINKKSLRRPWTLPVYSEPRLNLNLRLRCHPGSIIALHVVQRSEWHDWDTARFIAHFLRAGDTFVDVGANIGLYTLPAARIVGAGGRVIAVEPSPVNRARLLENLELNHITTVQIVPAALGAQTGELLFNDHDALAHLQPAAGVSAAPSSSSSAVSVPVTTLDDIMSAHDPATILLKVDVEGFELSVFQGGRNTLQSGHVQVILFEMNHSHDRYGVSRTDIFDFLRAAGFEIARYHHDLRLLLHDQLEGDLVAYTPDGLRLIQQRLFQAA